MHGRNLSKSLVPSLDVTRGRSINGGVPLTGPLATCRVVAGLGAKGFAKDAPTPLVSTLPRPAKMTLPSQCGLSSSLPFAVRCVGGVP